MKPLFWLAFAVILYTYFGYPILIALLASLRPRGWKQSPWPDGAEAPFSIVMPVHNAAGLLPAKLQHLLDVDPRLVREIIVISDGSNDGTDAWLQTVSDPRIRSIVLPQQVGKSEALNHGMAAATGEFLLFVDIRPRIAPGALRAMLSNFADLAVGCVAGELLLKTDTHDATATAVSGLYWRYEQWIRNCEAAWDSPVGVYGGFYAIRRSLATQVPPGTILDDMFQPLSIIRQGYRSVIDRNAIVYDTWPAKTAGEFSRKVRTLAGNFQLAQLAPWILSPANRVFVQLVSHKLLRLVAPYCFVIMLITSLMLGMQSPLFFAFAIAQALFWLLALASFTMRVPVLHRLGSPASALLVLNAAAVAGLYKFLFTRGPLWKIWSPTKVESPEANTATA